MHTMHLLPGVAKQPNLELKTRPKQLLGSLPLDIVLLVETQCMGNRLRGELVIFVFISYFHWLGQTH
jgi:hypothetical protein